MSPDASGKTSSSSKPLCHSSSPGPRTVDNETSGTWKREQELRRIKAKISNDSQTATATRPPPRSASKQKQKRLAPVEVSGDTGYLQPTVSSRARALSPYTHRRMCQLSDETRQRLSHLQLGPHLFKKTSSNQPPSSVRPTKSTQRADQNKCY
uniref:Uncharacterized protein n=1 Tax=Neogobius melanostomus TaxID=47308 RepID=A0A8C6SFP3_9GOBI